MKRNPTRGKARKNRIGTSLHLKNLKEDRESNARLEWTRGAGSKRVLYVEMPVGAKGFPKRATLGSE